MSDRIRALVESDEWSSPSWPDRRPRTGGDDGMVERQEGDLSKVAQAKIRAAMPEGGKEMIEAAVAAVAAYHFDCAMDWSGRSSARRQADRKRMVRELDRWAEPLRDWQEADSAFKASDEQRFRLGSRGFAYPEDMRELRVAVLRLVRAVDGALKFVQQEDEKHQSQPGPLPEIEKRMLVWRLGLAWEALTGDRIDDHSFVLTGADWPFLDVVSAVFGHLFPDAERGRRAERFVSEMVRDIKKDRAPEK